MPVVQPINVAVTVVAAQYGAHERMLAEGLSTTERIVGEIRAADRAEWDWCRSRPTPARYWSLAGEVNISLRIESNVAANSPALACAETDVGARHWNGIGNDGGKADLQFEEVGFGAAVPKVR